MRNFLIGYLVGAFLTGFASAFMEAYAKAVQANAKTEDPVSARRRAVDEVQRMTFSA